LVLFEKLPARKGPGVSLPPKVEHRVERLRSFPALSPRGLLELLEALRREHLTGQVVLNLSQGTLGETKVVDSGVLGRGET